MVKGTFPTCLTFSKMADHWCWHLQFKHIFSISNTEDVQSFLDIFTNKLDIDTNFFSELSSCFGPYFKTGLINLQYNILIPLQNMRKICKTNYDYICSFSKHNVEELNMAHLLMSWFKTNCLGVNRGKR